MPLGMAADAAGKQAEGGHARSTSASRPQLQQRHACWQRARSHNLQTSYVRGAAPLHEVKASNKEEIWEGRTFPGATSCAGPVSPGSRRERWASWAAPAWRSRTTRRPAVRPPRVRRPTCTGSSPPKRTSFRWPRRSAPARAGRSASRTARSRPARSRAPRTATCWSSAPASAASWPA